MNVLTLVDFFNKKNGAAVSYSHVITGWEVAGDYIYTIPGDKDPDNQMVTLKVPGYRSHMFLNWIPSCNIWMYIFKERGFNDSCLTGCLSLCPRPVKTASCLASPLFLRPRVRPTAPFIS